MEGRSFIHFVGFVHILKQTFILKEGSDSTDSGIGITHSKNFAVGRSGIICEPFAKKTESPIRRPNELASSGRFYYR